MSGPHLGKTPVARLSGHFPNPDNSKSSIWEAAYERFDQFPVALAIGAHDDYL